LYFKLTQNFGGSLKNGIYNWIIRNANNLIPNKNKKTDEIDFRKYLQP